MPENFCDFHLHVFVYLWYLLQLSQGIHFWACKMICDECFYIILLKFKKSQSMILIGNVKEKETKVDAYIVYCILG